MPNQVASGFNVAVLGLPAILDSDNIDEYNTLHQAVRQSIGATDAIDEILILRLVEIHRELKQLKRIRAGLLRRGVTDRTLSVLADIEPRVDDLNRLLYAIRRGESEARDKLKNMLSILHLDEDIIESEVFFQNIDNIDRLDKLIAEGESRLRVAITDVDQRRKTTIGR